MRAAATLLALALAIFAISQAHSSLGRLGAGLGKMGAAGIAGVAAVPSGCNNSLVLDFTDSCNLIGQQVGN